MGTPAVYEGVTHLTDRRVGFSVTRFFPPNLLFVPAKRPDQGDDTVVLIFVIYTHPDESSEPVDLSHVPITLKATRNSLYFLKTGRPPGFDPDDPRGPTEVSLRESRESVAPIPFTWSGKYFFDHGSEAFTDSKGRTLTGREVLDRVYQGFCNTAHWFYGLSIQTKRRVREGLVNSIDHLQRFLIWVLRVFCGRTIRKQPLVPLKDTAYRKEDLKPSSDTVTFRGIPVTLNSTFWSAVLMITLFVIGRLPSNLIVIPFMFIVVLVIIDRVLPLVLVGLLNFLHWLGKRLRFPGFDD